jgi:PAS domain S-box-containing protein
MWGNISSPHESEVMRTEEKDVSAAAPSARGILVQPCSGEGLRAEEQLDHFFALSLDMLSIAGFDGYFKRVNSSWEKTLGFTQEELLARPYVDFVHPQDREATIAEAQKLATGVHTISFENRYRCKDGPAYRYRREKCGRSRPSRRISRLYEDEEDGGRGCSARRSGRDTTALPSKAAVNHPRVRW